MAVQKADYIWRDYEVDGVSASGAHKPILREQRAWGTYVENGLMGATAGATIYDSKSDMDADTSQAANAMAWVMGDPVTANNGIYQFDGTSTWTRLGDLPYSYIKATNAGAGTANAIQATTSVPVPAADGGALIALPIVADNTASPVTVSFNGAAALTVKTNAGNDVAVGGLTSGMIAAGYVSGSTFRLLTDQTSAAIQAAAEAAQVAAEDAAEDAQTVAGIVVDQLPQRILAAPNWDGGFESKETVAWRQPEVNDLKFASSGIFGDMTLMQMIRAMGLPVEAEYFNSAYLDASLAANTLIEGQDPRVIVFGHPPYYMDSPLSYALIKRIILRSHTPGLDAPPTMVFENPLHIPFSFDTGSDDVRFEGCWKIRHRQKPADNTVPTIQFIGGKNIYFDTLVVENAYRALRFTGGENIYIRHLITDAEEAIAASGGTNIVIGRHTKIGSGANTVTGAQYINFLDQPSTGMWTPVVSFATPGDLSVAYTTQDAHYERRGNQVFISGTVIFTPTYTTASGAFQLGGLPFGVLAENIHFNIPLSAVSAFTWPSSTTQLALLALAGTDYMVLAGFKSGSTAVNASTGSIASGAAVTLRFAGTYETDE